MRTALVTLGALVVGGLSSYVIALHLAQDLTQEAILLGMCGGLALLIVLDWGRP